jgi:ribosomal protein S18 acetylase RimI-like enzyme
VTASREYSRATRRLEPCCVAVWLRPAATADAAALRELERDAGQRFREVGLDFVADDEPPSVEVLTSYARAGRAWVAVDVAGTPVGYVVVDVVDGAAHIEQVSVATAQQGRGIGRMLVEQARRWAGDNGLPAVTLTTFSHVPWNKALYEHLGFRVLASDEIGSELRSLMDLEASLGLDPASRVAMVGDPLAFAPEALDRASDNRLEGQEQ